MDCYGFEAMLEELERELPMAAGARAQAVQHAENCAYCRARLAAARLLSLELRVLAREDEKLQAPPHVEAGLMAAFRSRSERPARGWKRLSWAAVAAAAAIAVGLAAAPVWRHPGPAALPNVQARRSLPMPKAPAAETASSSSAAKTLPVRAKYAAITAERRADSLRSRPSASRQAGEVAGEFIALTGGSYPTGEGMVVRVQVPRSAPALMGLPMNGGDFSGTVTADVVLGEDGVARAIRFVPPQEGKAEKQNSDLTQN